MRDTKYIIILAFISLTSLILLGKAAHLQLFNSNYKDKASKTTLDQKVIYPSRGLIYDRNGKLMVYHKPIYDIKAVYNNIDPSMDTTLFCSLLEIDKEKFVQSVEKNWSRPQYHKSIPYTAFDKIDPKIYGKFQEHLYKFPGFYSTIRSIRAYPHKNAAHILGYMGEVSQKDIKQDDSGYVSGDYIGQSGLEKRFEKVLRGEKGVKYVLQDVLGREVSSYNQGDLDKATEGGSDLLTSIDLELQIYGEEIMQGKKGSIVAIEPKTGEVLCMVSSPGYDPNILNLDQKRGEAYSYLLEDDNKPFLDRSVMAKYPPGSIFKPILALIAYQEGLFRYNQYVACPGYYQYKTFKYGCHNHPPPYNIKTALANSCNAYFMSMLREVVEQDGFDNPGIGLGKMNEYLYRFGLGTKLGIDNVFENAGFIPTNSFYNQLYKNEVNGWKSTYIMSIGIGQGELQLTTLQMANLGAIIANKGYFYAPHLIKNFSNSNIEIDERFSIKQFVGIDSVHFGPVTDALLATVDYGTGYNAKTTGIDIAGKTGTSQNPHGEDHSVFMGFAPVDDPKIAIAVFIENAGAGSVYAAPAAGLMIEKYITREISPFSALKEKKFKDLQLIQESENP